MYIYVSKRKIKTKLWKNRKVCRFLLAQTLNKELINKLRHHLRTKLKTIYYLRAILEFLRICKTEPKE